MRHTHRDNIPIERHKVIENKSCVKLSSAFEHLSYISKCFTCFTKTFASSATYSRKPGDYNGTIIFEIDIMKNSSPLNLKFTFFATVKTKIRLLFCWTHSTLISAQSKSKQKNGQTFGEKVELTKIFN